MPLPAASAWDRSHSGKSLHSEAGFIAFDLRSAAAHDFMELWREIYTADNLFELPEWHDAYVYDVVRRSFEEKGLIASCDLAARLETDHHPFVNSVLGDCMDHLIGSRRKQAGCSFASDLAGRRDQPYWRVVPFIPEELLAAIADPD